MQPLVLIAALVIGVVVVLLIIAILRWQRAGINVPISPALPTAERPPQAAPLPSDLEAQARALLARGKKIEAIKLVRQSTQLGLKEAKEYVDALSAGGSFTLPETTEASQPATLTSAAQDEVLALLAQGRKIEAIKVARQHTGWGLKEAKDYVETLPASDPPLAPYEAPEADHATELPPDVEAQARDLTRQGRKIEAIKLVRQHTGWGLKEAKEYVDRLA